MKKTGEKNGKEGEKENNRASRGVTTHSSFPSWATDQRRSLAGVGIQWATPKKMLSVK